MSPDPPLRSTSSVVSRDGVSLIFPNREPTDLDSLAGLVLNMEIGPTLGEVVGVN